ncbi:MAG TPA: histidine kinase N-terminal 7TM domain-containing protein, partial [Pyrinomonadaceae bacterium]
MKGSVITTRTWFLLIGAVLLISAGVLNFRQRARQETPPWDGVEWVDTKDGIFARSIERGSAAERAWLLPGDQLVGISLDGKGRPEQITAARDVQIYLDQAKQISIDEGKDGAQIHYLMKRPSYSPEGGAYWADLDHLGAIHKWTPRVIYINLIGLIYLFVGFFVLFKQGGRAPFALHFATFCLAAFVFHFYTPVGSYRDLDLAIAFLDNAAFILFAPLFLHFCALYPSRQQLFSTRRWRVVSLYVPALLLLVFSLVIFLRDEMAKAVSGIQRIPVSEQLIGLFYWLGVLHLAVALVASALLLVRTYVKSKSTVVRQQVKWVLWGTLLAVTPFTLLYAVVYLFGAPTDRWLTDVAVLPLAIIPFAFGYSVLRYRLMDVELVVRRVFVYAVTTLAIALLIGIVVYTGGLYAFGSDQEVSSGEITLRVVVAVLAMAAIVMVAAPVKNFLQEQVDRIFYGERYDL